VRRLAAAFPASTPPSTSSGSQPAQIVASDVPESLPALGEGQSQSNPAAATLFHFGTDFDLSAFSQNRYS